MKSLNYLLLIACAALVPACATNHQTPITLRTIGPAPFEQQTRDRDGFLVVYSDWGTDATVNRHSPYKLVAADGKAPEEIQNSGGKFNGGPSRVPLAPGSYTVTAEGRHSQTIIVPVKIGEGQTTYVYLDGYQHVDKVSAGNASVVTLPDGNVAGFAAN